MATYDRYISYKSDDRPWADKFYTDLGASFPSIKVFLDTKGIPAGGQWRKLLTDANITTKHLLVFWSQAAQGSNEVLNEIAEFKTQVRRTPKLEGSDRLLIPVELEGKIGGGAETLQGFPALAAHYKPGETDRGVSNVSGPGLAEWKRAIKMIGDAILKAASAQPVIAAVVATNKERVVKLLDRLHDLAQSFTGPTLDEFLQGFGLQWNDVRDRYGRTALEWRPFGDKETIVELLEELRVQANSHLSSNYWFRWEYIDLTDPASAGLTRDLQQRASVVFVDLVSLYEGYTNTAFRNLNDYARQKQSVMIFLAPLRQTGVDSFAQALRIQSVPVLNDYFEPKIPPMGGSEFAQCAFNVQRISDIERLVRSRIASLDLAAKIADAKDTTGTK